MTLSDACVEKGIKLQEVIKLSGRRQSTLNGWFNKNPEFLEIVIMGCVAKRTKMRIDEERKSLSKEELEYQFNEECNMR